MQSVAARSIIFLGRCLHDCRRQHEDFPPPTKLNPTAITILNPKRSLRVNFVNPDLHPLNLQGGGLFLGLWSGDWDLDFGSRPSGFKQDLRRRNPRLGCYRNEGARSSSVHEIPIETRSLN